MQLSKNFTLEEFLSSSKAEELGIYNIIDKPEHLENIKRLVENILQPLRDYYNKPIIINSGYRNEELNKAIGGVKNSQHSLGQAVDIKFSNTRENYKIFNWIDVYSDFDQLIWELGDDNSPLWVHVSLKENNNRKEKLKFNGKTYTKI